MDACDELQNSFASVLLPSNFHYRDKEFSKFKMSGVSAILVVLNYIDNKWMTLMNIRSIKLRRHPGEVCFPGGMREPHIDHTPVETALREANEEIELKSSDVDVVGTLPPLITRTSIAIFPVLSVLKNSTNLPKLNVSSEVDHIFWVPLAIFLDNTLYRYVMLNPDFRIHVFLLERPVFGITAVLAITIAIGVLNQVPKFEYEMVNTKNDTNRNPRSYLVEIFNLFGQFHKPISSEFIRSKVYSNL